MSYDVIVIGSGFGGLICARQLARAGRSVLVLERQSQPGGCLQSFRRDGFSFDTGFHYVGGLAEGQRLHDVFSELGLMHLPWHRLDADGFDLVTIGGETFAHAEGSERFAGTLAARFPREREALDRYARFLCDQPGLTETGGVNAYDYLSATFHDPLLVNVLAANAMKMELRRETLPLFTFAHVAGSYIESSWRLRGDGGLIVRSLLDDIRRAGGDVVCRAEVVELVERGGSIVAARCLDGEEYEGRIFVSDVHPAHTFGWVRQSSRIRPMLRRRVAALANTTGIFTVSLVLKPGLLPYFNHNKYVYLRPNVWEPPFAQGEADRVMISCRLPQSGCHTRQLELMTPMPWRLCQQWEATHVGHRGEDYLDFKRRVADSCMAMAETVAPGLRDMVQSAYTSTPLTWRDYTLSPCGSAYGVRKDFHQPLLTMFSPRTPIPNLMLTGQSLIVHGLEGVAATALQTTREILQDEL